MNSNVVAPKAKFKKVISVQFYKASNGVEPVRNWLKSLTKTQKKILGEDLKTLETCWPIGMPLVRSLGKRLWEMRSNIPNGAARILFTMKGSYAVLLHGFIKKSQKTPQKDLETAHKRAKDLEDY
jgi:phage-related protein